MATLNYPAMDPSSHARFAWHCLCRRLLHLPAPLLPQVFNRKVLGYGGQGTIVFEGLLDKRQVAIKRMLRQFVEVSV